MYIIYIQIYKCQVTVVIAIIAILAAMLLPALSKARAKARAISCTNNQKTCALAQSQYAMDESDFIFLQNENSAYLYTGDDAVYNYDWSGRLMVLGYLPKDTPCVSCPAVNSKLEYLSATRHCFLTYGIYYTPGQFTSTTKYVMDSSNFRVLKTLSVKTPSTWFTVADTGNATYRQMGEYNAQDNFNFRHSESLNSAFLDGHVAAYKYNGFAELIADMELKAATKYFIDQTAMTP